MFLSLSEYTAAGGAPPGGAGRRIAGAPALRHRPTRALARHAIDRGPANTAP